VRRLVLEFTDDEYQRIDRAGELYEEAVELETSVN
jgi:hypothetical protein